jgi:hypothetical protein
LETRTFDTGEGNMTPQNDKNLAKIKLMDGHACINMFNHCESLMKDSGLKEVDGNVARSARPKRKNDVQK